MNDEYTPATDESNSSGSLSVERCPACNDLLWADAVHWCSARPVHYHDWENDPRHDLDQFGIRPEGGQWGKRGPPPGGPDAPDTRGPETESEDEEKKKNNKKKKKNKQDKGKDKDKDNNEDREEDGEQVESQPEPEQEANDFEIDI